MMDSGSEQHDDVVEAREAATDEALLAQFVRERDEQAFVLLVQRHGPLVMGVCRRVLADVHEADDAFQATFLVLAGRAGAIRRRTSLSAWLYGVAFRTARRLMARRRKYTSVSLPDDLSREADPLVELTARHDHKVLDEELNRLPARYRDPLVMHYLLGMPHKEVARELGESAAAIDGRMKRARRRLRVRLAARGVTVTGVLTAALLESSHVAVSSGLVQTTAKGAVAISQGVATGGTCTTGAVQLANQELAMMTLLSASKTIGISLAGCALVVLTIAGIAASQQPEISSGSARRIELAQAGGVGAASNGPNLQLADDKNRSDESSAAPQRSEAGSGLSDEGSFGFEDGSGSGAQSAPIAPPVADDDLKRWETIDYKVRNEAEHKIESELESETTLELIETPLNDVVNFLSDLHGITILIDTEALDAVGVGTDTPITMNLKGISLRSALRLMLRPLGLDYVVREEVMLITSIERAEQMLETRVYELRKLTMLQPHLQPETLAEVIRTTIRPESWNQEADADGKTEPARATLTSIGGALVVTQSQRGHEAIVDLIEQLSHFSENPLYDLPPPDSHPPR